MGASLRAIWCQRGERGHTGAPIAPSIPHWPDYFGAAAYNRLGTPEVTDLPSIGGQSSANPLSLFGNHQFVLIGGTYRDPSYGTTAATLDAVENDCIAGFVKAVQRPLDEPVVGADQLGMAGQHNDDPPGAFWNHFIVRYDGRFYDPSYGAGPFASENEHENAAIDGIRSGPLAKKNDPVLQELLYLPQ